MLLTNEQASLKIQEDMPFSASYCITRLKGGNENHTFQHLWHDIQQSDKRSNLSFPFSEVNGVMRGTYGIGEKITNMKQHEEVSKDWVVLRHSAGIGMTMNGYWPMMDHPIAVMIEGRDFPSVGILIRAKLGNVSNGHIFLELVDQYTYAPAYDAVIDCDVFTRQGEWRINKPTKFKTHDVSTIIAWSSIDSKGYLVPVQVPVHPVKDFFLDCEFDDNTKTLISVGVVCDGTVYYAYDNAAIPKIQNDWVMENVVPILGKVPVGTHVFELGTVGISFQAFIHNVIKEELGNAITTNIKIHVDFPTDVAYISPLFHLGDGKRIGKMPKLQFHVDYVDAYPTQLEGAVQHNAAWDALALYHHVGYAP